jgi:hypothetical protein
VAEDGDCLMMGVSMGYCLVIFANFCQLIPSQFLTRIHFDFCSEARFFVTYVHLSKRDF